MESNIKQEKDENLNIDDLKELDKKKPEILIAIHDIEPAKKGSYSTPRKFVCSDGKSYWLKWRAQQGLSAELISGRLAHLLDAGPIAEIINVPDGIFNLDGVFKNLIGLVVGTLDIPGTENSKDIQQLLVGGKYGTNTIDFPSFARALAFQSWLGVGDPQALVDLTTGKIYSIDHGAAFGNLVPPAAPKIIFPVQGIPINKDSSQDYLFEAVKAIEKLPDKKILEAVSNIPDEGNWNGSLEHRYKIFEWFLYRRDQLRKVMEQWIQQL